MSLMKKVIIITGVLILLIVGFYLYESYSYDKKISELEENLQQEKEMLKTVMKQLEAVQKENMLEKVKSYYERVPAEDGRRFFPAVRCVPAGKALVFETDICVLGHERFLPGFSIYLTCFQGIQQTGSRAHTSAVFSASAGGKPVFHKLT